MARKRIDVGHAVEAEIALRTGRGESAETIFEAIGRAISVPTIRRRQHELRGNGSRGPAAAAPSEAEGVEVPDEVPEGASIAEVDKYIAIVNRAIAKAELNGNLTSVASLAQKASVLLALRHRVAPIAKPDPNENPDMRALAQKGEERLMNLARGLFTSPT